MSSTSLRCPAAAAPPAAAPTGAEATAASGGDRPGLRALAVRRREGARRARRDPRAARRVRRGARRQSRPAGVLLLAVLLVGGEEGRRGQGRRGGQRALRQLPQA